MGRHSTSGGDDEDTGDTAVVDEATVATGRHARMGEPAAPSPQADGEPLVSLADVAPDDGPLGLIADQMTEPVEPPAPALKQAPTEPPPEPSVATPMPPADEQARVAPKSRVARGNQSTAADLALLRAHSAVRARVIAALVVPFVLYTAVLFLIGRLGVYLIWVWIPLVSAGVVAGSILDAEHRRRAGSADG